MATTTTTQVTPVNSFFDKLLLKRALPLLAHDRFGQRRPLPEGNSKNIKFRRYSAFAVATTPLTEGTAPASTQLAITDLSATVAQYGAFTQLTDILTATNEEQVKTEATEVLGEQAGQTLDVVYRDILVAGTTVAYANAVAARVNVVALPTTTDLDKIIRTLQTNNAKPFTEIVKAGTGIGTQPVAASYYAIVHPDVWFTLYGLTGVISVEKYGTTSGAVEGEVGAYKNLRFILSTNAKVFTGGGAANTTVKNNGTNVDVYATLVFGKDAYGISELRGNGMKQITKELGSAGTADPLDQNCTIGWKATTTCKILNDAFMLRFESAASL